MAILDRLPAESIACDICIVGTGPVGLALARTCEQLGLRVLALEAGSEHPRARFGSFGRAAHVVGNSHAPLRTATRTGFGGTSWAWSGICASFDPIDFQAREHVPHSGWPVPASEVERFYPAAADFLGATGETRAEYDPGEALACRSVRCSRAPQLGAQHREHFRRSRSVVVCLNTPVIGLELSEAGDRIAGVTVRSGGAERRLAFPVVVLAAGGLRTTQLLLSLQRRWPNHFGGPDGALGRYYMGHLTGWLSTIRFRDAAAHRFFDARFENGATARRMAIPESRQLSGRLLNAAFWPSNAAFYDPSHASGPLSLTYLALSLPVVGRRLLPVDLRAAVLGPGPRQIGAHLRNVASQPLRTLGGAARAMRNLAVAGSPRGALAGVQKNGSLLLQYHAEHAPNPSSRVTLSERQDEIGLQALKIDLRFTELDAQSVVDAHDILAGTLSAGGVADLIFLSPPERRRESVLAQAYDGYHQMGTTRMSRSVRDGVVDTDCRLHGIAGLYVAASSVFPTSSHANPTLTATALAIRLGHHLHDVVAGRARS